MDLGLSGADKIISMFPNVIVNLDDRRNQTGKRAFASMYDRYYAYSTSTHVQKKPLDKADAQKDADFALLKEVQTNKQSHKLVFQMNVVDGTIV